ncbi:DUF1479-domain-containing protein [Hypoxylon fragiforme]|uniref:DUF1479-domain-containing protein n=1 Tax=Hypoxylon fragiforme TaxID=63214 RepID=UPI0020C6BEE6|nr:DUF1479-domain-containing protein [Hypoxylon fragiforme]KAI2607211.1 DUF1479-domain-containing protein [Hypoxylon fragiforme]
MSGPGDEWPDWPEMTAETGELNPDNIKIKKEIAAAYGEAALRKSWLAVCERLKGLTDEIAAKRTSIIPELAYDDFFKLGEEEKQRLRDVGCFVVRGLVPEETANGWFEDLNNYVQENQGVISGWPAETPFILQLYWSRTQMEARTHPRAMALHQALNEMWHDDDDAGKAFASPLVYADAARIRPPGVPFRGLGPHIDAGSLSRWADPNYRQVYEKVWTGSPDEYDAYDLTDRKRANPAHFPGGAHSHVLRLAQGWTALTAAGPHEGSLMLFPEVKTSIAYVLLRPFFQPPANADDVLDAEKWTFDTEDPWFPGVWRDDSQYLSPDAFPHLRLKECLVHIPKMNPGDTVWWHCDMCHAVEIEHRGEGISSVAYVAATPTTEINSDYVKRQLEAFLKGTSPEDFPDGCDESKLKGYPGSDIILNGGIGRKAVGFAV